MENPANSNLKNSDTTNKTTHSDMHARTVIQETPSTSTVLYLTAAVFVLAAAGIYFAWKKPDASEGPRTADEIRTAFAPPAGKPANAFMPPDPSQQTASSSAFSLANSLTSNTGNTIPQPQAITTPRGVASTPPTQQQGRLPAMQTNSYQDAQSGFTITLPENWVAKPQGNQIWFYNSSTGVSEGFIESYPSSGASLSDIETILKQSPSVTNVSQTNVGNISALRYSASPVSASGVAFIDNGKVYYAHGAIAEQGTMETFHIASNNTQQTRAVNPGITYNASSGNLP